MHEGKPRFEASRARKEELADRFWDAAVEGNLDGLLEMLAEDVVAYGDGGGQGFATRVPVHGRKKVGNLIMAGAQRGRSSLHFVAGATRS